MNGGHIMYKNSLVHCITKIMVDVLFYAGILCLAAVPFLTRPIGAFLGLESGRLALFITVMLISGACSIYILYQLRVIFRTLMGGNPFVDGNVTCLRKISVGCAMIGALYLVRSFFLFSVAAVVVFLVFLIGCLFCLTVKDVFKQAVSYKEENDFTV